MTSETEPEPRARSVIEDLFSIGRRECATVTPPPGSTGPLTVSFEADTGAARYSDSGRAWITHNPTALHHPPLLPVDAPTGVWFPPEAAIDLTSLRAAVEDYRRTGQRPTCVDWREVNW